MVTIGQQAPDFELRNQDNAHIRLHDLRGNKVVIFAFPKANTSGCTQQACAFRDDFPRIESSGAVVLGISTDSPASLKAWHDRLNLQYDLLSDPDKRVITALGAGENKLLGFVSMPGARRSYWVLDETGKIMAMQIGIGPKASLQEALKVLEQTSGS